MARTLVATALLLAAGWATPEARADTEPSEEVLREAERASIDPIALLGALNSEAEAGRYPSPCEYLFLVGDVPGCIGTALTTERPPPPDPMSGAVAARVACIEAKESGGANVWNRSGSGAGGVMQYLESTFRAHAAEIGHPEWSRWVPWQARALAAYDLAMGRRTQWTVSGC